MGFGGGMSFQPYDEEVEMFPAEMLGVPEEVGPPEDETVEPQAKRAKPAEENEPEPPPEPGTDAGPSTGSSSSPSLPLVAARGRTRLVRKTPPAGPWVGVLAPAAAPLVSFQPPEILGTIPLDVKARGWWDSKSEREKYRYVWNYMKRHNLYNTYLKAQPRQVQRNRPAEFGQLEKEHRAEFVRWLLCVARPQWSPYVGQWLHAVWGAGGQHVKKGEACKLIDLGSQALMTWQGPWGCCAEVLGARRYR